MKKINPVAKATQIKKALCKQSDIEVCTASGETIAWATDGFIY
ncbi:hypothetical protein [Desulfoplanes sp.]